MNLYIEVNFTQCAIYFKITFKICLCFNFSFPVATFLFSSESKMILLPYHLFHTFIFHTFSLFLSFSQKPTLSLSFWRWWMVVAVDGNETVRKTMMEINVNGDSDEDYGRKQGAWMVNKNRDDGRDGGRKHRRRLWTVDKNRDGGWWWSSEDENRNTNGEGDCGREQRLGTVDENKDIDLTIFWSPEIPCSVRSDLLIS